MRVGSNGPMAATAIDRDASSYLIDSDPSLITISSLTRFDKNNNRHTVEKTLSFDLHSIDTLICFFYDRGYQIDHKSPRSCLKSD